MFVALNQSSVPAEAVQPGVTRQRLLAGDHGESPGVAFERLTLAAGATLRCDTPDKALDWLYLLAGEARLVGSVDAKVAEGHSATLPPRFETSLSTAGGASLLRVSIADIARFDRGFLDRQPHFMLIDWTEEPVLAAERDGRKRVALVAPGLCDTAAIRIDMLVYAAGDISPSHRYEGAVTLIYILEGSGAAVTHGSMALRQDDLVGFADGETRQFKAQGGKLRFLQFFVPGTFKTAWSDPGAATGWRPTGLNINGGETGPERRERLARWGVFDSKL
jgi:hypothetical protein